MRETLVFVAEKRRVTMRFGQKMLAELNKRQRTKTVTAQAEKRHEPFISLSKCITENTISVQNRRVRRQFR